MQQNHGFSIRIFGELVNNVVRVGRGVFYTEGGRKRRTGKNKKQLAIIYNALADAKLGLKAFTKGMNRHDSQNYSRC